MSPSWPSSSVGGVEVGVDVILLFFHDTVDPAIARV
jgi:hypothetical protein